MPWADLSDVRLYYEVAGEGPPLLLVPGLGATCRSWDPIVPDLAGQFSLVMPDNRDVGKSVARRPSRTLSDMAADLVELLDHLQLDRAHVMGISLGGVIAQALAIEHPSRVDRLVLISTAHRFGPYLRDVAHLLGRCLYKMPYARYQRTVELLGTAPAYYDAHVDEVERRIDDARRDHAPKQAILGQLHCLAASQVSDAQFKIDAPTFVISGEYDALIPNCYAARMAGDIPHSEFHVLAGCGHNPVSEAPEVVLPLLRAFLNAPSSTEKSNRLRDGAKKAAYDEISG